MCADVTFYDYIYRGPNIKIMNTTVKLHSLSFSEGRTYLFVLAFVAGNIVLPQLCHLVPQGGLIFLPIYFFTLIGAYKFGLKVGLLTAVLSPSVNSLLFGMPPAEVLPLILFKSVALAVAAAYAAKAFKKVSLPALLLVILAYQVAGTGFEWAYTGSFAVAVQDFRIGLPGMLIQLAGGYAVLKALAKV